MFLDHKGYRLDDLIYMRIMVGALAVCETTEVPVVKYQAELDVLFSTSLPSFYGRCDKDGKKALRDSFESAYHHVERELIESITAEANLWLETPAGNNYHDKYHLAR